MRATGIQTQNSRPEYRALLILRSASALAYPVATVLPDGFLRDFTLLNNREVALRIYA